MNKPLIKDYGTAPAGYHVYAFHCPGCGYDHSFRAGGEKGSSPQWSWNGSFTQPTFAPSLLCNQDDPKRRCHSFVTDGKIKFLADSWHPLAGKTVDLPEWEPKENSVEETIKTKEKPVENEPTLVEKDKNPVESVEKEPAPQSVEQVKKSLIKAAEDRILQQEGKPTDAQPVAELPKAPEPKGPPPTLSAPKVYPCRMWHKGGLSSRLIGSYAEERALGAEWTDQAPTPKQPAPLADDEIHAKRVVPTIVAGGVGHHLPDSGHSKLVVPGHPKATEGAK